MGLDGMMRRWDDGWDGVEGRWISIKRSCVSKRRGPPTASSLHPFRALLALFGLTQLVNRPNPINTPNPCIPSHSIPSHRIREERTRECGPHARAPNRDRAEPSTAAAAAAKHLCSDLSRATYGWASATRGPHARPFKAFRRRCCLPAYLLSIILPPLPSIRAGLESTGPGQSSDATLWAGWGVAGRRAFEGRPKRLADTHRRGWRWVKREASEAPQPSPLHPRAGFYP